MPYHEDNWRRAADLPALDTPRLHLRKYTPDDVAHAADIYTDPLVCEHLNMAPDPDEAAVGMRLSRFVSAYQDGFFYLWAVVCREKRRVIGSIVLNRRQEGEPVASIGYCYARAFWGQGYATEALNAILDFSFSVIELNRIEVEHFPGNDASGRVIFKAGFSYEGLAVDSVYSKGRIRSLRLYALLRSDWERLRGLTAPEPESPVDVRRIQASDAEELGRLLRRCGEAPAEAQVRDAVALQAADQHTAGYAAYVRGTMAGYLQVGLVWHLSGERVAESQAFLTEDKPWREQVEARLLSRAESWAERMGASHMLIRQEEQRHDATGRYGALGYGCRYKQVLFTKKLTGEMGL